MARFDDSLARSLDFEDDTAAPVQSPARAGLRLASPDGLLRGPEKYRVLDRRRRQAQIKARHALNLFDMAEGR